MNQSERDLLTQLLNPSTQRAGFTALMQQYQKPLYAHLRRMLGNHDDADDALQNTFVKVWRKVEHFRGDSALYSWLYRIATNEALALIDKRRQHRSHGSAEDLHVAGSQDGPDGDTIARKLQEALLTLPPKQRQVFDFRYFEEMTYEQIAAITGTSVGALKASYFHAVRKMEEYLTGGAP